MNESSNVSFRGEPIPEIVAKSDIKYADTDQVVNKLKAQKDITIDSVHFENHSLSAVKLTSGDIVPVETAIALAQNNLINGYSTGATMRGGRTLRSKPSPNNKIPGIYSLPRF